MVLSGVGGSTIAEAQERISFREFNKWVQYRNKRGGFNTGMRIEESIAVLSALYVNSKTKNGSYKRYDFMDHKEEPAIQLDQAMENWK